MVSDLQVVSYASPDSSDCPAWCEHEHGGEAVGFHHEGATTIVELSRPVVRGESAKVYVNVSQNVPVGAGVEPPFVEIQDEFRTLLLLTPVECIQLAEALLEGAGQVAEVMPGRQVGDVDVPSLVASVIGDVGTLCALLESEAEEVVTSSFPG
jgi:hypothetical protein